MGWWSEGKIKPHVSETLPLEGTIKGLQAVMNRESTGRIVVTPQA
jgi:NADPH2:quinone reductase